MGRGSRAGSRGGFGKGADGLDDKGRNDEDGDKRRQETRSRGRRDDGWDEEDGQGRLGTGARTGKDVEDNKDRWGIG